MQPFNPAVTPVAKELHVSKVCEQKASPTAAREGKKHQQGRQ
jgi:hypothetical protein